MTFLLDTNAVSDLLKDGSQLARWVAALRNEDRLTICTIVRGEILFGIARLPLGRQRTALDGRARNLLDSLECLPLPLEVADTYALLKASQQRSGRTLAENDLWIAATALRVGATLVTRDLDFRAIPTLKVISPHDLA